MSLLDTLSSVLFGWTNRKRQIVEKDNTSPSPYFNVFSADAHAYGGVNVNHGLARDMYRNIDNTYALSAHLLKPIIDSAVSFIDTPTIRTTNKRVLSALTLCQERIDARSIIRIAEREGTCFVWVQYDDEGIKFVIPRPETVTRMAIDPISKEISGYHIEDVFSHVDVDGNEYQTTIIVQLTKEYVKKQVTSTDPKVKSEVTKTPNVLGFIPITRFTNDVEPWELRGHSEVTSIEPTLKMYHNLMIDAANAQKQNSPKLKISTKNVRTFLENNFGSGAYERIKAGQGINLSDRDVYIMHRDNLNEGDDMEYVVANSATGDSRDLLKLAFMNSVEGSQTPELIFGASMGASLSSVQEQRPAYIRKIRRKQQQYSVAWKQLFDMCLDVMGYASYAPYNKGAYELIWSDPEFDTNKERSDAVNAYITALVKARGNGIMSDKEIHTTLTKHNIVELNSDFDEHINELDETTERKSEESVDKNAAANDDMTDRYANQDYDNTAVEDVDKNSDAE
jgi:hypothetical protein